MKIHARNGTRDIKRVRDALVSEHDLCPNVVVALENALFSTRRVCRLTRDFFFQVRTLNAVTNCVRVTSRHVLRQKGGSQHISVGFFEQPISETITPGPVVRPRMFEARCPYVVVAQRRRNVQTDACRWGRVKTAGVSSTLVDTAYRIGPVGNGKTTKDS